MDANPDGSTSAGTASTQSMLDHNEIRLILSNLSHELCRPLISLRAGFDLLLGDGTKPIDDDQRGHVRTMVGLCDDLLRLTRSYLDYAGLVQGTRPLCFGTFTIGALIRDIDREFAPEARSRRLQWECALENPDGSVTTDASRCQQIFSNLVANALKYTPEGGRVRVLGRHDGKTWSVIVTDSGPGIPAESLGKVFEPFFRLSRDERSGIVGNGLGLAICREMVGQLGGEISLHSTPGQGTRVTVRFPVEAVLPTAK